MPQCQCIAKKTNLQCRKTAKTDSMFCEIHQRCIYAIRIALPPVKVIPSLEPKVQTIVAKLKQLLAEVEQAKGKENKLVTIIKIYDLLITPDGLKLVEDKPNFKKTTKAKLIELIEKEHLTFLIPYYEIIIGEKYVRTVPLPLPITINSSV